MNEINRGIKTLSRGDTYITEVSKKSVKITYLAFKKEYMLNQWNPVIYLISLTNLASSNNADFQKLYLSFFNFYYIIL